MSLFIACLLIYHFHMAWWWYAVAGVIWTAKLFGLNEIVNFLHRD